MESDSGLMAALSLAEHLGKSSNAELCFKLAQYVAQLASTFDQPEFGALANRINDVRSLTRSPLGFAAVLPHAALVRNPYRDVKLIGTKCCIVTVYCAQASIRPT